MQQTPQVQQQVNQQLSSAPLNQVVQEKTSILLQSNKCDFSYAGDYQSDCLFLCPGFSPQDQSIPYRNIVIDYISFARSFYLVDSNNDLLSTSLGNTTLPHGNYDVDTLTSVILAAYPGTITSVTYSTNTGKITLVGVASFTVYSTSTCYTLIGGNAGDSYTGTSITFPYPVNLLGIRYLNFKCLDLPVSNWVGGVGKSPTLLTVGVDIGQFVNQLYTNNTLAGESSLPYSFDLNSFHIQVTDENDNLVNFNGVPWVMSISVTSFKVIDFSRRAIFGEVFNNNIETIDVLDETDIPPSNAEDHPILKNANKETQVTK